LLAIFVLFQIGGPGMQYVFTIANAFQGCLIFYCHILLKEEGRLVLITMKRTLSSMASGSRTSSKKQTVTRGMRQTAAVPTTQQSSSPAKCAWRTTTGITHAAAMTTDDAPRKDSAETLKCVGSGRYARAASCTVQSDYVRQCGGETVNDVVDETDAVSPAASPCSSSTSTPESLRSVAPRLEDAYPICDGDVDVSTDSKLHARSTPDYVPNPRKSSGTYISIIQATDVVLPAKKSIDRSDSYSSAICVGHTVPGSVSYALSQDTASNPHPNSTTNVSFSNY
jgi:hypothetical protein